MGGTSWTKVYESATPDNDSQGNHTALNGLDFNDLYVSIIWSDFQDQSKGKGWTATTFFITKAEVDERVSLGSNCIYAQCISNGNGFIFFNPFKSGNTLYFRWGKYVDGTADTQAYIRVYVR